MSRNELNRRAKRWPSWVVLVFVVVGLLAFGATRDTGPRTPDDRIESISKRLACPVCQGESVYESRNPASNQIRVAVRQGVNDGLLTDEQIIADIAFNYQGEELLVPTASGVEALAWALPATAFVVGVAGLGFAFRRWQLAARQLGTATDDDYALVAAAIASDAEHDAEDDASLDAPLRTAPGEHDASLDAPLRTAPGEHDASLDAPLRTVPGGHDASLDAPLRTAPGGHDASPDAPLRTAPGGHDASLDAPLRTVPGGHGDELDDEPGDLDDHGADGG